MRHFVTRCASALIFCPPMKDGTSTGADTGFADRGYDGAAAGAPGAPMGATGAAVGATGTTTGAVGAAAGAAGAPAEATAAGVVAVIASTCPDVSCAILASRFSPAAKFMISVCGLTEIVCACADEIADADRKMAA